MSDISQPADPPSLAAVVLCLNEAGNLPRCLASLDWCDERVVVDSGSTDGSQRVAMELGARVFEHRQTGRFLISEQRNWALDHAQLRSNWVLFLDADEEIGPNCKGAIQAALAQSAELNGFELTPRYWFLGRWLKRTQGYPNWHPRMVRRGHLRFEGGVWESFPGGSSVSRIQEPYEHYAFSKGIDDWLERHLRYADWDALKINDYLISLDARSLGTTRSLLLRKAAARLWPLRPLLRFIQKYFIQLGVTEGWQGFLFASLMSFYDLIAIVKLIELRHKRLGKPL